MILPGWEPKLGEERAWRIGKEEASSQKEGWTVGLAGWEPQIFR